MMRKILIITYYFSQDEAIASVRLKGLVKFLPEFGWKATVLTVKCTTAEHVDEISENNIIEIDCGDPTQKWEKMLDPDLEREEKKPFDLSAHNQKGSLIIFVLRFLAKIHAYPSSATRWYEKTIDVGGSILTNESFDIIFSSYSPATSHLIASYLSKRHNVPWIADFRDLWSGNHFNKHSKIREFLKRELEIRTISSAKVLTTVSQPLVGKLSSIHVGKKVYSIPNGFDLDIVNPVSQISEKFTICYTGSIYKGYQDPEMLFEAIKQLIEEAKIDRKDIVVDFYGRDEGWLQRDIENYGLSTVVKIHGIVPREIALQNQRNSQILLLLAWNDPHEKGIYTGKVFEYLAAKRPILALGLNNNVVTDLIQQTNAGFFVSSVVEAKETLLKWYYEYKSSEVVNYSGIQSEINKYSHREMAKKFAGVFDENLD